MKFMRRLWAKQIYTHTLRRNQRGISLIELVVVIALMGILIGGLAISFGLVKSGNVKKSSQYIVDGLLDTQTNTLSIDATWIGEIENKNETYYFNVIKDGAIINTLNIGSKVQISFQDDAGEKNTLVSGNKLHITYTRGSGKFDTIEMNNGEGAWTSLIKTGSLKGTILVDGNGKQYKLILWYKTGKLTKE
jgi:prepilin-type N-terminal cleavage/methylation domain-containing protein